MLICCDVIDACTFYGSRELAEVRDAFQMLQRHAVPDAFAFPSLRAVYCKTGDIVYLPAGTLVLEKNMNELNLSLRTPARLCLVA